MGRQFRRGIVFLIAGTSAALLLMGARSGGAAPKTQGTPLPTTTPVFASGVAPVTNGSVVAMATPNLTTVGSSAPAIQVATAPIDGAGNFVLQPDTTSGAMASLIAAALAQNNGWVNVDLVETGSNGATTIQSIARQYVDASGQPVSPAAFHAASHPQAPRLHLKRGLTASSGLGHWVGNEADNGSTTVDPVYVSLGHASDAALNKSSGAASSQAPAVISCIPSVTVVNQTNKDSVIGEFHTPKDVVRSDTGFVYGKSADTDSDVGVEVGGANWSVSGSVHIGNAGGSTVGYYPGGDVGYKVVSGFFYKEYHYVYPLGCSSNYYQTKQYSWSATPTPAGAGENVHSLDGSCLTRPIGQVADLPKGGTFDRSSNNFIKFGGAFTVFGFTGGTQSGASSLVQVHYKAGQYNTNHYICGNGNSPLYSTRIFAEG
jgi:hypothetical protein